MHIVPHCNINTYGAWPWTGHILLYNRKFKKPFSTVSAWKLTVKDILDICVDDSSVHVHCTRSVHVQCTCIYLYMYMYMRSMFGQQAEHCEHFQTVWLDKPTPRYMNTSWHVQYIFLDTKHHRTTVLYFHVQASFLYMYAVQKMQSWS